MNDMVKIINQFRKEALDKIRRGNAIGYFCSYVPAEIIESYGFIPVRLAGLGSVHAENEGEKFIHNEACSFCKESLGANSLKLPPYNNIKRLIIPSGCDQMKRHGEILERSFNAQNYPLFVPATHEDESSLDIYWKEIKWINSELESIASGKRDLKEIVSQYNKARKRLMRLNNIIEYQSFFELMHLFFISPVKDFHACLDEIEKSVEIPIPKHSGRHDNKDKIRLMIVGSPIGYGDNFIQNALEKSTDASIVYDATCTGNRFIKIDVPLSGDIIANIALAYFNRPSCVWRRPNSGFYQYIKKVVERYRVQGVIYKTLKFCDLWKYEVKRFKDWVNLPVIQIENTYSPAQNAQISKRIAAFLETFR